MSALKLRPEVEGRLPDEIIATALATVREHLGMEVAYLSEFVDGNSVFRAVDAPGLEHVIAAGDSHDLKDVYCRHILDGRLPALIPDTSADPLCMAMAITTDMPVGSHVGVPIRRGDGSPYGMFCCLSTRANPTLTQRDLSVMRIFADLVAEQVNTALIRRDRHSAQVAEIQAAIRSHAFRIVYQPIVELSSGAVRGFEALSRFEAEPYRAPDLWFAEASGVGLGVELELAAIDAALVGLAALPEPLYLSFNASPGTVASGRLAKVLEGKPLDRLVIEITEHDQIGAEAPFLDQLMRLREGGLRIAVDDAGAGYSGLQQIIRISPDILKLDRSLVTGIHVDPVRRSLAAAMVHFATETKAQIVAEGIETAEECRALARLGMHGGQGWYFGRPADLATALAACGLPARGATGAA
ncbi:sensor domain-containing phosphodiesterase [Citreimonas salinaria]|uniref:EAL domain, c-di-GMP-specific phosphodiesterase class I (Or its enzymatically inactive variant) n=1 Tax=Citreimonas salinaria TaxID=321339 RepID=A0A1H3J376_9RHOB|nr:EAL domain-containing protein [Citreimonas salinaria]SDY34453.1 EAL domain, c-di-GMP-specific phosphodiesterase class I (or its enzymatically inactive variant) [Citreimonas salinaria]